MNISSRITIVTLSIITALPMLSDARASTLDPEEQRVVDRYAAVIRSKARMYDINPNLLTAVFLTESHRIETVLLQDAAAMDWAIEQMARVLGHLYVHRTVNPRRLLLLYASGEDGLSSRNYVESHAFMRQAWRLYRRLESRNPWNPQHLSGRNAR